MVEKSAADETVSNSGPDSKIARKRNSAGSMTVGLASEGNIKEIFQVADKRMLMIKEHATYEIKMANRIDPDQNNYDIPNVQQRIFSAGTSSEILQGILLTSKKMFDKTYLAEFDCPAACSHALNAMGEIMSMDRIFERMRVEENKLIQELEGQQLEDGFIIPTLEDAYQDVKNFIQRADHFVREINLTTRIFEKNFGNWDGLIKRAHKENPSDPDFIGFLNDSVPYIHFIRETRNSVEHPQSNKRVEVTNFTIDSSGTIITPSIEVFHPKFREPKTRLLTFLDATIQSLVTLYGAWIARLCARNANFGGFGVGVLLLPEDQRDYPNQRYSYALMTNDGFQKIG